MRAARHSGRARTKCGRLRPDRRDRRGARRHSVSTSRARSRRRRWRYRRDSRTRQRLFPSHRWPPHAAHAGGAVEVVGHVVFAGPDQLDGGGDVAGDLRRFGLEIVLVAASEATTHEGGVNGEGGLGQLQFFGDDSAADVGALRGAPGFALVALQMNGDVHRFHAGVCKEGKCVDSLDALCRGQGVGVATAQLGRPRRRAGEGLLHLAVQRLGRFVGVGSEVPGDAEGVATLDGGPGGGGHDYDTARGEDAVSTGGNFEDLRTPGVASALEVSKLAGVPPKVGQRAITA